MQAGISLLRYGRITDFPLANAKQSALRGGADAFIAKFDPTGKTSFTPRFLVDRMGARAAPSPWMRMAMLSSQDSLLSSRFSSGRRRHIGPLPDKLWLLFPCLAVSRWFCAELLRYVWRRTGELHLGLAGDLAVDASGNAYLAGTTDISSFQITAGTLATSVIGYPYNETFVLKVDSTGKLVYSTVIPGTDTSASDLLESYTNDFIPCGIAVDASGDVTIAGIRAWACPQPPGSLPTISKCLRECREPRGGLCAAAESHRIRN